MGSACSTSTSTVAKPAPLLLNLDCINVPDDFGMILKSKCDGKLSEQDANRMLASSTLRQLLPFCFDHVAATTPKTGEDKTKTKTQTPTLFDDISSEAPNIHRNDIKQLALPKPEEQSESRLSRALWHALTTILWANIGGGGGDFWAVRVDFDMEAGTLWRHEIERSTASSRPTSVLTLPAMCGMCQPSIRIATLLELKRLANKCNVDCTWPGMAGSMMIVLSWPLRDMNEIAVSGDSTLAVSGGTRLLHSVGADDVSPLSEMGNGDDNDDECDLMRKYALLPGSVFV